MVQQKSKIGNTGHLVDRPLITPELANRMVEVQIKSVLSSKDDSWCNNYLKLRRIAISNAYCSSRRAVCGVVLACANMAAPDCVNI